MSKAGAKIFRSVPIVTIGAFRQAVIIRTKTKGQRGQRITRMKNDISAIFDESAALLSAIRQSMMHDVATVAARLVQCFKQGNKVLVCGNGGSAADAQHFVAELVGRFMRERKPFPCIALTTNSSLMTAWSNDYSFDTVFERQVEALGKKDDVLLAISTSGNSKNLICAIHKAHENGMIVLSLLGKEGGAMKGISDMALVVPSTNTPRIQEAHILLIHILCELVEKQLISISRP